MHTNKKLFGALLFAVLAAHPSAQSLNATPNTAGSASLGSKLQAIETLKAGGNLTAEDKFKLETLWSSANHVAELNDACREVALNKPLQAECQNLPSVLAEFEDRYLEVTGEVRLSAARVATELNDRREMINRCYDAFPFEMFSPPELFRPEGLLQVEPLERGSEISWEISLSPTAERKEKINAYLTKWFKVCKPHVLHQTTSSTAEFAPLFVSKMAKGDPKTGIVMKPSGGELVGSLTKTYTGIYSVNKQDVFKLKLEGGSQYFALSGFKKPAYDKSEDISAHIVRSGKCGYKFEFKGKQAVGAKDLRGGIKTKIDWIETVKKGAEEHPKKTKEGYPILVGTKPYNCFME